MEKMTIGHYLIYFIQLWKTRGLLFKLLKWTSRGFSAGFCEPSRNFIIMAIHLLAFPLHNYFGCFWVCFTKLRGFDLRMLLQVAVARVTRKTLWILYWRSWVLGLDTTNEQTNGQMQYGSGLLLGDCITGRRSCMRVHISAKKFFYWLVIWTLFMTLSFNKNIRICMSNLKSVALTFWSIKRKQYFRYSLRLLGGDNKQMSTHTEDRHVAKKSPERRGTTGTRDAQTDA